MTVTPPLILYYHRVGQPDPRARYKSMWVLPGHLALHVRFLKWRGFRFTTLREAMRNPQPKTAVITFDDGYQDNLTHGLPVLQRLNVPATVFVITGDVGKRDVIWSEAGDKIPSTLMSWEELRQLHKAGWEIGSHGHEHLHFGRQDAGKFAATCEESARVITREIGESPFSFCYPYGDVPPDAASAVKKAGYSCAVTTLGKIANNSKYLLPRRMLRGAKLRHVLGALSRLMC